MLPLSGTVRLSFSCMYLIFQLDESKKRTVFRSCNDGQAPSTSKVTTRDQWAALSDALAPSGLGSSEKPTICRPDTSTPPAFASIKSMFFDRPKHRIKAARGADFECNRIARTMAIAADESQGGLMVVDIYLP